MNRFILPFLLFIGLFAPAGVFATHIVGGEMTYRCLGNNQYEITLTVYRDCYTGVPWFDNPAYVAVYNAEWNKVGPTYQFALNAASNDTLSISLDNPCLTVPPDVCVHRTIYKRTITLEYSPGGYTLVYQRCCRNNLIRNTPDPLNTGISIVAEIRDDALLQCNGGATFNSWPPVAICINEPIDFDHAATDPDGDSLVYRLCTPLNGPDSLNPRPLTPFPGPYEEIIWVDPPYNESNMLGGVPLTIDVYTGFMTGIPNTIGNFVVGVCVDEYRDGLIISTTRRDFQYNVSDCGKTYSSFFAPAVSCDTLRVDFVNNSPNGDEYLWYFDWPNTAHSASSESPFWVYPDTGSYTVALIVQPNDPCADTSYQTISLTNRFVDADFGYTLGPCNSAGLVVNAQDLSADTLSGLSGVQWTLFKNNVPIASSTETAPDFLLPDAAEYVLQLVSTGGNGCADTLRMPLDAPIPPINDLEQLVILCEGDTVGLFPDADPAFQYAWSPPDHLNDPTAPNPLASPDSNQMYSVTISGNGPCVRTGMVAVQLVNSTDTAVTTANPSLVVPGVSTELSVFFPGAQGYQWFPPDGLSDPTGATTLAFPEETTTYTVRVELPGDCDALGTVTVTVRAASCEDPYIFFPNAFSPNGDGENDLLKLEGLFVEEAYWVIYNRWGEQIFEADNLEDAWDGTYRGEPLPAETYGYYLRVRCVGDLLSERKGNITLLR
ncbi:MAG: gliding motility-associated C-terminal domain-containing protein [Saprospiraceae bacterium]|nr:gliding motility-associated C-terminal domain-containing protein [Saprospiraceae bacterium]